MNANDPAFPISLESSKYHTETGVVHFGCGLTKREYFAAMAMQALINADNGMPYASVAKLATSYADELIKQLEK